jgi:hypothetical protein
MRALSTITDPKAVRRILDHLTSPRTPERQHPRAIQRGNRWRSASTPRGWAHDSPARSEGQPSARPAQHAPGASSKRRRAARWRRPGWRTVRGDRKGSASPRGCWAPRRRCRSSGLADLGRHGSEPGRAPTGTGGSTALRERPRPDDLCGGGQGAGREAIMATYGREQRRRRGAGD